MGEIKSVKVDNWGVFFLQKLQNFFNKTDYCDLTLQFYDNSQLKVHRLVLSACTDYFNVLEQTCEVIDDALIMPSELQADVVVPIVNFMYTGTLEFELKMYGKLLRTAKEMNMTVLLRLLEAHRRTMESVGRQQGPSSPKSVRRRGPMATTATATQFSGNQQSQQRRIFTTANSTLQQQQQRRVVQTKNIATNASTSSATIPQQMQFRQQIGSTSLLKTSSGNSSQIKAQYGNITVYETTPQIKNEPDEYSPTTSKPQQQQQQQNQATSPFEQLRKGYNNNKRPAVSTFISPPAKKPNIEDVKEFAEQQRMRKQIAAEYGDPDPCEYESMLDDDIHNYDDDDDGGAGVTTTSTNSTAVQATTSRQQQQQPQGSTTITFKQEQNDKPPTIVVKDSSNSKMNHAKIISEVLRQYPHLVKSNKNIKLKIMPNVGGQTQKIIVKKDQLDNISTTDAETGGQQQKPQVSSQIILKASDKAQLQQQEQQPHSIVTKIPTAQKPITAAVTSTTQATQASGTATTSSASGPQVQKRRIDSKTMHSLIALGAENTTGPWLCLRCGVNGRPISIPSYRGFRRHLINTHKENIDEALCEQCGWRSKNNRELHYHLLMEHKLKTSLYTYPECLMCAEIFLNTNTLNQHMVTSHPEEKQQCIYCNKIFARELQLYTHMKTYHKLQALEDGIIDYSDEEFTTVHDEEQQQQLENFVKDKKDTKIKILSDISLPSASSLIKLEPSSEAAALSTVASGIATSIGITSATAEEFMDTSSENVGEPKFVNVDGNEMLLTDEQRKEILSQLNQEHGSGGVVMVLNEPSEFPAAADAANAIEDELHDASAIEGDAEADAATAAIIDRDNESGGGGADGTSDFDDSQIYNEFTTTTQSHEAASDAATTVDAVIAAAVDDEDMHEVKKNTSSNLEESKESIDNLEWAENLISAHEMADEVAVDSIKTGVAEQQKAQKEDDISKKLKELTGDWSEDDNDDDDEHEEEEVEHEAAAAEEETETAVEAAKQQTNTEEEPEGEEAEEIEETVDANLHTDVEKKAEKEQQQEEISEEENVLQSVLNADTAAELNAGMIKEPKEDEDDIDNAMKSLHKEDDIEDDKEKNKENQKDTVEIAASPRADESAEKMKMDVDDVDTDEENASNKEKKLAAVDHVIEKENNEESKVKEAANKSRTPSRDEKENISSVATLAEVDDKTMLADLISFAGDEQEFLEEKASEATKETSALDKLDDEKTLESKEIASTEVKGATAEIPVADVVVAAATIISTDSKDAISKEEAVVKIKTDITTTAAVAASSSSSTSKSEDKVKSLISEWGDDEDDDDDDIGGGNDNKDDEDDL